MEHTTQNAVEIVKAIPREKRSPELKAARKAFEAELVKRFEGGERFSLIRRSGFRGDLLEGYVTDTTYGGDGGEWALIRYRVESFASPLGGQDWITRRCIIARAD